MTVAEIIPLRPYPPGLLEAHREWLEHYGPCPDCLHERDHRGHLRFCGEGRRLWYAMLDTLPPGLPMPVELSDLSPSLGPRTGAAPAPSQDSRGEIDGS